jgi:hypothetical protein
LWTALPGRGLACYASNEVYYRLIELASRVLKKSPGPTPGARLSLAKPHGMWIFIFGAVISHSIWLTSD